MKKSIFFMLIWIILIFSACSDKPESIHVNTPYSYVGLKSATIPAISTEAWKTANRSKAYTVFLRNDKLYIDEAKESSGCRLDVDGGSFVGTDGGEFGGSLVFASGNESYTLLKENVRGLFKTGGNCYALTGLFHLDKDEGKMYRLEKKGKWEAKEVLDLKSYPFTYLANDPDSIYIVTSDKLLRTDTDSHVTVMVDKAFWKGLYPNSLVYWDIRLFIGMRGGISTYMLSQERLSWYPIDTLQENGT